MKESPTRTFPEFSLARLLKTVFEPKPGRRIGILIDLRDPKQIENFAFLKDAALTIQRHAHDVFHLGLKNGVLAELGLAGGEMFACQITGGSNLELPDAAWTPAGLQVGRAKDVYPSWALARRNCRPRAAASRTRSSWERCPWTPGAATTWAGI